MQRMKIKEMVPNCFAKQSSQILISALKKYSPQPPYSPIRRRHFNKKPTPRPSRRLGLPLPPSQAPQKNSETSTNSKTLEISHRLFQCAVLRTYFKMVLSFSLHFSSRLYGRGKKSIHHHRGTPLFSVCRPTPRSQSQNSYGVYHFPGKTREKGIHHRSGKKGIHHRASDPEKEKIQCLHGGGAYFFLADSMALTLATVARKDGIPIFV